MIFALEREAPPLRQLQDALQRAGYPAEIGVGITGPATDAELDSEAWEAAFVRWTEPEMHEVWLIEREIRGEDEEAERAVEQGLRLVANHDDAAGQLIVMDHLRRCQAVYTFQIYDALFADDNHPAWAALDVALRFL